MLKRRKRRRMGKERKRRSHRVSDKIQRARSDSSVISFFFFLPLSLSFSFSPFLSLLSIARASRFSRSVRTRSFTSPACRCTFFSNPFLRYSAALNGRLLLPSADRHESASGRRSSSVLFRFYYKPFGGRDSKLSETTLKLFTRLSRVGMFDTRSKDPDIDWF